MALPSSILQRDTRANQPAATAVLAGTVYCVSDEDNILEQSTGAAWVAYSPTAPTGGTRTIGITIDGGGSTITTGEKGFIPACPFAGTITAATLIADQSGSIVIDVWKDTYANAPPDDADSITASAPPTLSSAQKSQDTTLTGWTTSVSVGDVFGFNVDSATTVTRVTLVLSVTVA